MITLFINAFNIGIITLIIGTIIFNLTINKINKENNLEKSNELFGLNISFFATGFILYIIINIIVPIFLFKCYY